MSEYSPPQDQNEGTVVVEPGNVVLFEDDIGHQEATTEIKVHDLEGWELSNVPPIVAAPLVIIGLALFIRLSRPELNR